MKKLRNYSDEEITEVLTKFGGDVRRTAIHFDCGGSTLRDRLDKMKMSSTSLESNTIKQSKVSGQWVVETNHSRISKIEDVISELGVDMNIWRVKSFQSSNWDTTMKLKQNENDRPFIVQNTRLKVVFERIISERDEFAINSLLTKLENKSSFSKLSPAPKQQRSENALEISLFDIHYGMRCFAPAANKNWTPELCRLVVLQSLEQLIELSKTFGPFDRILLPFGNDFFHIDSLWHTTTAGTPQPEADSFHHSFEMGEKLCIEIIERLRKLAEIFVIFVPGNHDRSSSFMLGRIISAYYKNDKRVSVDASSSPYKFHEFGCNLIGYEHGKEIKPLQLAGLMANEQPEAWARTQCREWHVGHHHRRGQVRLEEQGVTIEYIPSIVPTNEWHKIKGFNNQKRGAVSFVWSKTQGQLAKLQVTLDNFKDKLLGR